MDPIDRIVWGLLRVRGLRSLVKLHPGSAQATGSFAVQSCFGCIDALRTCAEKGVMVSVDGVRSNLVRT